ncbi:MAG: hypothetical protein JWN64_327 [Parcubacteria group bacterium]|nr:hypothetical protein [Parcubacteria group bacterium]
MQKDFDAWNEQKKRIEEEKSELIVYERDIWWCSVGLNIGDEQDGKKALYERPIIVLKTFGKGLALIVPTTSTFKDLPYYFLFENKGDKWVALITHVHLISTKRFNRYIGKMNRPDFSLMKERIKRLLF